jgi:ABC-2 type transport system ATP-binding protein
MTAAPPAGTAAEASGRTADGALLGLARVTMRFGNLEALKDVTLGVPRGTILGVIGPSGAGKTTMIRVLTGALAPTEGSAVVMGEDPRRFRRRTRERIGYMPQQFTLYPDLTAGENVDFVASLFGLLWFRRRRRVREVLEIVDLWPARGRRAADLSGGMQRRLELASALVHDPELLFLDEPTAGIDPLLRARIWDELHRLKNADRTLIVTTQYVNEAEECDMVALIAQGRLAALAEPDELRRQATGGDIVEIETAKAFDGSVLEGEPTVRRVSQISPRGMRVVVADAGSAMPAIVSAINDAGAEVVKAGEYRLTFDEVFAELVGRNQRRVAEQESGAVAHERNADEARALVDRELDRRREATGTSRAAAPVEVAEAPEAARAADVGADRTMDDQARNLPPEDAPATDPETDRGPGR